MNRTCAAILAVLGALLIFPSGALADAPGGGDHRRNNDARGVCVRVDDSGRGSTDVEVNSTTVGPGDLPAVQVIATPAENRPIGPLAISVNAQVAVLQVVLRTNDMAILDGVNVGITQGNGPGAVGAPAGNGGNPPAAAPPGNSAPASPSTSGITISVNAQVAVVQVVVGTNNVVVLKNINVNINQGNQVVAGA
jgi:hypothetical protein